MKNSSAGSFICRSFWSFGMWLDHGSTIHPWQYIFGRGLTIFILLNLYLYFEEGFNFYKNYKKIGKSGIIGGCVRHSNDFLYLFYN